MNQRPASVDSPRQKRRVFVIRRHDYAVALEGAEVFGQSQRHSGAAARIGGVGDHVLLQFGHERDARIFDAPDFFGKSFGLGINVGSLINLPSIDAVAERAAQRCDKPRRSSTRQSSRVVPSASSVAPALNTLLMEYGQSLLVRIGFAGCRSSSGSKRALGRLTEHFAAGTVMKGHFLLFRLLQRTHFEKCHQER